MPDIYDSVVEVANRRDNRPKLNKQKIDQYKFIFSAVIDDR